MGQIFDVSDSVVIQFDLLQKSAILKTFNPFDEILSKTEIGQLGTLVEALNFRDTIAHGKLNLSVISANWTVFGAKHCKLNWSRFFLCIFGILRCIFHLILIDYIAIFIDLLNLYDFFALPGLLLLFKDLLLSLLFFRGLSSLLAHNFYRSSLGRSDLGSCCLWLFSRYFLILLTHASALII